MNQRLVLLLTVDVAVLHPSVPEGPPEHDPLLPAVVEHDAGALHAAKVEGAVVGQVTAAVVRATQAVASAVEELAFIPELIINSCDVQ